MTWRFHHKLVAAIIAMACAVPGSSIAQSAPTARPADAPADNLTAQDREVLSAAEQLATEASQILEQWITTQAIAEDTLFSRMYYPIPKTEPRKFSSPYDALSDRDIAGPEDRVLARFPMLQYAILTDVNGYVPTHNTRFAQPLTGNMAQDYINNRTKRLLGDLASFAAAHNEAHYLLQRTRLETGDVVYDLSVPVIVRGKHWGCVRIGYRRAE
jgi:methyl-accepting chemotaxis protein